MRISTRPTLKLNGGCGNMRKTGGGVPGSKAIINKRQRLVLRYYLRGATAEETAQVARVDSATIYRDLHTVKALLAQAVTTQDLYTLRRCFAELDEEWREAWLLYHRPSRILRDLGGSPIMGADGQPERSDDRGIKMMLLGRIHEVIAEKAKLCGFYSPKTLDRLTMIQTEQGTAVQIERIPYDEQLRNGADRLKNDEGFARSRGLRPEDLT